MGSFIKYCWRIILLRWDKAVAANKWESKNRLGADIVGKRQIRLDEEENWGFGGSSHAREKWENGLWEYFQTDYSFEDT